MSRLLSVMVGMALGFAFLVSAPAGAQTLVELPFSKKLKLAEVGDEEAQMAVAEAYERGDEARLDVAAAAKWYRDAALAGNVEAQFRLARIVSKGAKGLTRDLPTAAKLYEGAAKSGHHEAENAIGLVYQNGLGVPPNEAKAVEWYKKAAEAKLATAENNLGLMYLNGRGVTRDPNEAFKLFERAANQGDGWGLNNLGGMYEMGWGVEKDAKQAAVYYQQAFEMGVVPAQDNLLRLGQAAPVATTPPEN